MYDKKMKMLKAAFTKHKIDFIAKTLAYPS